MKKYFYVAFVLFLFSPLFHSNAYGCRFVGLKLIDAEKCNQEESENKQEDEFGIIAATVKCGNDCLDWKPVGGCLWVTIIPPPFFSIEFDVSLMVSHYLPDYVVSIFSHESPYEGRLFELTDTFKDWLGVDPDASGGIRPRNMSKKYESITAEGDANHHYDYKKAEIVVNPGVAALNEIFGGSGMICPSNETIPSLPKFISDADPSWRSARGWADPFLLADIAANVDKIAGVSSRGINFRNLNLNNILSNIGTILGSVGEKAKMSEPPENWGAIYPRTGFNILPTDAQSALVTAHRASDILTGNPPSPFGLAIHRYIPVGTNCEDSDDPKCWPPGSVILGEDENKYQLIVPRVEDSAAPLARHGSWANSLTDNPFNTAQRIFSGGSVPSNSNETSNERWAWVLWRKYSCCAKEGAIFVTKITTEEMDDY